MNTMSAYVAAWTRLQQPQDQRYPVLHMHAGSFCLSVIHRTLTWTTGSLTCVRDHSYACVYTRGGVGHKDSESAQHFDSEKHSQFFLVLLTRFEPRVFGSQVRRSTNWATPTPRSVGPCAVDRAIKPSINQSVPFTNWAAGVHVSPKVGLTLT